ncbi:glycosyltransferase family 4 protein [Peribacillus asahii]|uniref:glycosyltransferase family 4 protein n=1 Tax=Peribacillus asahii TaxID=228899 RepID=UPI00207AF256|nr:glycosyltransferase family 4 protein [Peribacillus asahii]USK59575.1 glycosyltransferase family 4 protein [Peribacillus asahii]
MTKEISKIGINQDIFIPVRKPEHIGMNKLNHSEFESVNYYYANILNRSDRIFYKSKMNKQLHWAENQILTNKKIDMIHAHTVFSDGGTAYKLYKKYGINYLLTVRNTDINIFFKYAVHLRPLMYNILLNAKKIVFISYAYREKMKSILPNNILKQVENKFVVIPNGIESYWHINKAPVSVRFSDKQVTLLFIGLVDKNKNLETVIRVCNKLVKKGYDAYLNVIGDGPMLEKNKKLSNKLNIDERINFYGYINDKDKIKEIMNKSDIFVLPSLKETFGLVYVEAMSQGLPVIYSKGEGIDGFFRDGEIGYSVDSKSVNQIVDRISNIIEQYETISNKSIYNSESFKWNEIARRYLDIYNP